MYVDFVEERVRGASSKTVVESISGHLGLFNLEPSYMEQVDQHLGELLDSPA
jgi:homoserine O-acetyltransferase/O-succinyltransferase